MTARPARTASSLAAVVLTAACMSYYEIPIETPIRVEVRDEQVPSEALYFIFRTPPDGTRECDALDLGLAVLAEGDSSRLTARLVRKEQLVQFVAGGMQRLIGGVSIGLLILRTMPGADLAQVEAIVNEELAAFAADGPTADEIERVKAQAERAFLDSVGTAESLADQLSKYATLFDDPNKLNTALDDLLSVDAAEIQAAAAATLTATNQLVLSYHLQETSV